MGQYGRLTRALSNPEEAWVYNGSQEPRGRGRGDLKFSAALKGMVWFKLSKLQASSGFSRHNRIEFSSLRRKKS